MKIVPCSLLLLVIGTALSVTGAEPQKPSPAAVATNETVIRKSVFAIPASPRLGRDPFFPASSRVYATVAATEPVSSGPVVPLEWHGISGSPEKRLVMINGQTFGKGDLVSVNTPTGRVRVRCIDIQPDAVMIEVNGERRILRLRTDR